MRQDLIDLVSLERQEVRKRVSMLSGVAACASARRPRLMCTGRIERAETPPLAFRGGCTVADVITGAHVIVYSRDAEADRVFFRDTLGYRHVDAGGGWLIFKLPPAEVAVHPSDAQQHELYLMCDDLDATMKMLADNGVGCSPPTDEGWGRLTRISLPGGGELGLYEPRHSRATAL